MTLHEVRAHLETIYRRRRLAAIANRPSTTGVRWDVFDDVGCGDLESAHLHAVFIAAGHGYLVTEQRRRPLGFTVTCFCGSPIGIWEPPDPKAINRQSASPIRPSAGSATPVDGQ